MAQSQLWISHPFAPVWNTQSRVLVLGTFPSVQSRKNDFYYGHPQNRFWQVLAALMQTPVPTTVEHKRALLLQNGIALWDVLASCNITGSADQSIRNPIPNDITILLTQAPITHVFANGQTAGNLYRHWCASQAGMDAIPLPSTSPANAAWTLPKLIQGWQPLVQALGIVQGK